VERLNHHRADAGVAFVRQPFLEQSDGSGVTQIAKFQGSGSAHFGIRVSFASPQG
jgi:hypothetical protein